MNSDRCKALWWHRGELLLALGVLAYVFVGWAWSESHNRPQLVETRPR